MSRKTELAPKAGNKFIRVKCPSCSNEQTVYSLASTPVKCIVCNHELAETGAGKIRLKIKPVRAFE
ncbi:MAG: 30S ribosomal protein S27e [Candidatus Diapherotrites archaeon]|uniref:Small ribosomal subunit protein eS27 n=1 Tax=Candidatus Iainarchaeum sp. TaxID=3101447 RepID=A0A8T4KWR5_9ARCH|nr:30S ribosomal protein S27e [Candidatus Diapherotrites archaeon]